MSSARRGSQFSGAAAMFRKKEKELIAANKTNDLISPGKFKTLTPPPSGRRFSSFDQKGWTKSGPLERSSSDAQKGRRSSVNPTSPPFKLKDSSLKGHKFNNYNTEPDVKIQVNNNVQRSINARKQKRSQHPYQDNKNVPEHIRKAREREERRARKLDLKKYQAASLLQAVILGWYVRTVKYPILRDANMKYRKTRLAVLTIQKTFRMYIQRKRFKSEIEYIRWRERTKKEIKRMYKKAEKMPKKTKQDIRDKQKEYEAIKKDMLNEARKQIKEEDEKIRQMETGNDMIQYLNDENDKVKELISTIQREQRVLDKQFELLTTKSEEIASNFKSLQEWVDSKNKAIKKNEASDQKCRYRYLPKYREDLAVRNKYCITEFRVKELYKRQLDKISKEVLSQSEDPTLVKYVKKELKACKKELAELPDNPPPEGLEHRLKY